MLEELAPHLEAPSTQVEMRFLLLEQKFLEHLDNGSYIEALKVNTGGDFRNQSMGWCKAQQWNEPPAPPRRCSSWS